MDISPDDDLANRLGLHFADPSLLAQALTHPSAASAREESNERMEFLGDAILDIVVAEHLYRELPNASEGRMTELKSALVRRETLAEAGRRLDMREALRLGRSIEGRDDLPDSVFANLFEALVAAVYLDGGLDAARHFVLRFLDEPIDRILRAGEPANYKSALQEYVQADGEGRKLVYRQISASGPDHSKRFVMAVDVEDEEWGRGEGGSTKEAEQQAARDALAHLPPPPQAEDDTEPSA